MKLLITGANGFLGRYVVAEAVARGHNVRAMVRAASDVERNGWNTIGPQFEFVQADLRARRGLAEAMSGIDAVLHLAAAKSGDLYAQLAGTVVATENLLWAMREANVVRMVAISTFSVYDYRRMTRYSTLDESSPVEFDGFDRDEYAQTKLIQERLVRDAASEWGLKFTILRPGVIWGRDNLWTARLGAQASKRWWIRMGSRAPLPLTYVENCAQAIVRAAETDAAVGQTLNIVDDQTPTQKSYLQMIQQRTTPRPKIVPVPLFVVRAIAASASLTKKRLLKNRAKVPGVFIPGRLDARTKPLRFTNQRIKQTLGWTPRYGLEEAMGRATGPKRQTQTSASPGGER